MLVLVSSIKGAEAAVDALSIWLVDNDSSCTSFVRSNFSCAFINYCSFISYSISFYGWESMIPMGLYAATGYVRCSISKLCTPFFETPMLNIPVVSLYVLPLYVQDPCSI